MQSPAPPLSPSRPSRVALTRRSALGLAGVSALAGAATLSGCSSGEAAKDLETLQVWGAVPPENGPQDVVDHYMEKNPGQKVVYTRFVNDERGNLKVNTALQGGVDIDVFFTYDSSNLAMRSYSGMAADLGPLVRETPQLAPFLDTEEPKALLDGETVLALATTKEPNFLLVNETVREEVGFDLPEAWDLEEYLETVRAATTADRYGTYKLPDLPRIQLGPNFWYTDQGGSNFEHPAFLEHFELTTQMIREGHIFPWSQVLARQIEAYQQNNFIAEDFAIWATAPFSLRFLHDPEEYPHDFLTSCAPVPTVDGADWNSGFFGNYIQINAKSPKQELAADFVTFWLLEGAADMAPGGKIPTLDNVDHEILLTAILGEDMDSYFDVDSFRRTLFESDPKLLADTDLTAVAEITHSYEQQRDVCWLLERAPDRAIDAIHADADALIQRFRED